VWDIVREVTEAKAKDPLKGGETNWPKGQWAKKNKKQLGAMEWELQEEETAEEPAQFRRKMTDKEWNVQVDALKRRLRGHKLVGVHATTIENLGPLMMEGIAADRIGTGHGKGKGQGFYIIPTMKGVVDLTGGEKSAAGWDPFLVAVYLPKHSMCMPAKSGDNVQTLEEEWGEDCFFKFGADEAVIPPSLFAEVILVRDPSDITMADPGLPAEATEESALSFLEEL
jgi:hypothetical protein